MLGLNVGGGGGQVLEALAKGGDPLAIKFGVPMKMRKVKVVCKKKKIFLLLILSRHF